LPGTRWRPRPFLGSFSQPVAKAADAGGFVGVVVQSQVGRQIGGREKWESRARFPVPIGLIVPQLAKTQLSTVVTPQFLDA
jgi:hypothetical protein